MSDDEFEPHLGRPRARGGERFTRRVLREVYRAGGGLGRRGSGFFGSRLGRGAGAGRVLRDRYARMRTRRVIVKTRIVRPGGSGSRSLKTHLRYLQREGVARDGSPGELYDAVRDRADGPAFAERCGDDRHQFRIIVAPEDAAEYDDLKGYTRRLMAQVERDLGTRLDWVAVDHHNTGHPHTHIVIRGRDECGQDLVIAREYVSHGMRARAEQIVGLDLGPRTDREIEDRLVREVEQERLTSIDRGLIREAGMGGEIDTRTHGTQRDSFRHNLRVGRLRKLEHLGLATEFELGRFRLSPDLEPTLRRMGERGDIIRTMQRALTARNLERAASELAVLQPGDDGPLIGRVVERGFTDELQERHYLVVDGLDGRTHYAEIGRIDVEDPVREGSVVALTLTAGRGSTPSVRLERLATMPLEQLAVVDAATWLDRDPGSTHAATRDTGFGREVRAALRQRQQWLIEQGLAERRGEEVVLRRNIVAVLRHRELARSAAALSSELGLDYAEAREGRSIGGTYRRRIDLVSGRFAVIAGQREFTLVPWQPELERHRDRTISGRIVGDDFALDRGRERSGPSLPSM